MLNETDECIFDDEEEHDACYESLYDYLQVSKNISTLNMLDFFKENDVAKWNDYIYGERPVLNQDYQETKKKYANELENILNKNDSDDMEKVNFQIEIYELKNNLTNSLKKKIVNLEEKYSATIDSIYGKLDAQLNSLIESNNEILSQNNMEEDPKLKKLLSDQSKDTSGLIKIDNLIKILYVQMQLIKTSQPQNTNLSLSKSLQGHFSHKKHQTTKTTTGPAEKKQKGSIKTPAITDSEKNNNNNNAISNDPDSLSEADQIALALALSMESSTKPYF